MTTGGRGVGAREAMIDAAERLIAEKGLGALSMREVASSAGQRNHSAVQYHFGSRAGLVEAVFDDRMAPIDLRRASMLAALEATDATGDLWALAEAVVRPLGEAMLVERPGWYGRFLVEVMRSEPELLVVDRPAMASLGRATRLMVEHMDAVPAALRGERLAMAVRAAVGLLADREEEVARLAPGADRSSAELHVTHVVDLVHAMVSAPPSAALVRQLDAASGASGSDRAPTA